MGRSSRCWWTCCREFEKQTGHKVTVENDTAGALTRRIMAGEAFDIVILPLANLDQLSAKAR